LAHARKKFSLISAWPRVEIDTGLREKVKSDSERPGTNSEDSLRYVRRVANSVGQSLFGDSSVMDSVVQDICLSYKTERERSNNWQPEPADASSFIATIEKFKERLDMRPEEKILLFGHSGWARFAFSAFLPSVNEERQSNNLQAGARQIYPLRNCGAVHAIFRQRMFQDVSACGLDDDLHIQKRGIHKMTTRKCLLTPIMCLDEAKIANVVPDDASLVRMHVDKKTKHDSFKTRLFTFSSSGRIAHLAWANKWGHPKSSIPINDGRLTWTRDRTSCEFFLSHTSLLKGMHLRTASLEEFHKFEMLLDRFQNHQGLAGEGIASCIVSL